MADIANRVLKILLILSIVSVRLSSNIETYGPDDEYYDGDDGNVQNENKWNPFQRTETDRDLLEDEDNYDNMRSDHPTRTIDSKDSVRDEKEAKGPSDEPAYLKRYIHDPAERYRQSKLVNPELTFDSIKGNPKPVAPQAGQTAKRSNDGDVLLCDEAGCSRLSGCNSATGLCSCMTSSGEKLCSLEKPAPPPPAASNTEEIPLCDKAGCSSISKCDRGSSMCSCRTSSGDKPCYLVKPPTPPKSSSPIEPKPDSRSPPQAIEEDLLSQQEDQLRAMYTPSPPDVISCEVAGCLRMTACERKTEVCQCTTHSGVIPCSLKPPKPSTGEDNAEAGSYDPCTVKPCQHSGTCSKSTNLRGFECTCKHGYQGPNCQFKITHCDAEECTMIYACNKETHMCKCKTNTKEKACILKKPGVLDSVETNIEEGVEELAGGDPKTTIIAVVAVLVILCLLIHFIRVTRRMRELSDEYRLKINKGDYPVDEPPGCCAVNQMLCQQMFCCASETSDKLKVKNKKSQSELKRRRSRIKSVHSLTDKCLVLPDERMASTSKLPSKTSFGKSTGKLSSNTEVADDYSLNANIGHLNRQAKYKRAKKNKRKQLTGHSSVHKRGQQQTHYQFEKCKPRKRYRGRNQECSESDLLSELESSTTESDDTPQFTGRPRTHHKTYSPGSKSRNIADYDDSDRYPIDCVRQAHSYPVYPNVSSKAQTHSSRSSRKDRYPDTRLRSQLQSEIYYPETRSALRYGNNAPRFNQSRQAWSYINNNNNNKVVSSETSSENYLDENQNTDYKDEAGIQDFNNIAGNHFTLYDSLHELNSMQGYPQEYSNLETKTENKVNGSPRVFIKDNRQSLHNSQSMIHSLAEQYLDGQTMAELTGYPTSNNTLPSYCYPELIDYSYGYNGDISSYYPFGYTTPHNHSPCFYSYEECEILLNEDGLADSKTDGAIDSSLFEENMKNNTKSKTKIHNSNTLDFSDVKRHCDNKENSHIKSFEKDGDTFYYIGNDNLDTNLNQVKEDIKVDINNVGSSMEGFVLQSGSVVKEIEKSQVKLDSRTFNMNDTNVTLTEESKTINPLHSDELSHTY